MITMIDMGLGNLDSVHRAFQRVGAEVHLSRDPADVSRATAVILPGVGAFGDGMQGLAEAGLIEPLQRFARDRQGPLLGICLGMQLLADRSSEHGDHAGLGLVPGRVERLTPQRETDRVPNMGWCDVTVRTPRPPLAEVAADESFYFAHSYHFVCEQAEDVAATIEYGGQPVTAAVIRDNLYGVQFHPEKSQDAGLSVLESFVQHCLAAGVS